SLHFAHTTQTGLETIDFALDEETFFFSQAVDFAGLEHFLKAGQFDYTLLNGDPVGEGAAQPALVNVGHATTFSFCLDSFLRLAFGADEKNGAAVSDSVADFVVGVVKQFDRL